MTPKQQCDAIGDLAFAAGVLEGVARTTNAAGPCNDARERVLRVIELLKAEPFSYSATPVGGHIGHAGNALA